VQSTPNKPVPWYVSEGGYFQLPRAFAYDDRLSHTQCTTLVTLASFVYLTSTVFPSRKTLHVLTGIDVSDISGHTTTLEDLGWLEKRNSSGQTTRYVLKIPAYAIERMKRLQAEAAERREGLQKRRAIEAAINAPDACAEDMEVGE